MSKPVDKRPMIDDERLAILAMRGNVRFPVASWDKRFFRDVLCPAEEKREISEKSSAQLWRLFIRYRRQVYKQLLFVDGVEQRMDGETWERLMRHAEANSAPDFRKQRAAENEQTKIDDMKRKYQEAMSHA